MKDDIEAEMLLLQLTRTGIQDERKEIFKRLEELSGKRVIRPRIPDYLAKKSQKKEEKMKDNPSEAEKQQTLTAEGERLLKLVPNGSYLIVLDVYGKELSSEELSAKIDDLTVQGVSSITFLIGGAFGLSPEVRKAADLKLSFSKMTFTHQMVRLLLVEQIYRAFKISRGEKYHW